MCVWANLRSVAVSNLYIQARDALLAASPENAASLEAIESAMLIVCLDDFAPVTREDAGWGCWVGDGRNRFYDKHQCEPHSLALPAASQLPSCSDCLRERQVRLPRRALVHGRHTDLAA